MGRPSEIKTRVARNVIFENEELKEFEEIVGKDHVSREIRALISNFLKNEKKGEAQPNPLNLVKVLASCEAPAKIGNDIIDIGIYETTDYCNKVRQLIKSETDIYAISRAKNNFNDLKNYCEGEIRLRQLEGLKIKR